MLGRGLLDRAGKQGTPGEGAGLQRGPAGLGKAGLLSRAVGTPGGGEVAAQRGQLF